MGSGLPYGLDRVFSVASIAVVAAAVGAPIAISEYGVLPTLLTIVIGTLLFGYVIERGGDRPFLNLLSQSLVLRHVKLAKLAVLLYLILMGSFLALLLGEIIVAHPSMPFALFSFVIAAALLSLYVSRFKTGFTASLISALFLGVLGAVIGLYWEYSIDSSAANILQPLSNGEAQLMAVWFIILIVLVIAPTIHQKSRQFKHHLTYLLAIIAIPILMLIILGIGITSILGESVSESYLVMPPASGLIVEEAVEAGGEAIRIMMPPAIPALLLVLAAAVANPVLALQNNGNEMITISRAARGIAFIVGVVFAVIVAARGVLEWGLSSLINGIAALLLPIFGDVAAQALELLYYMILFFIIFTALLTAASAWHNVLISLDRFSKPALRVEFSLILLAVPALVIAFAGSWPVLWLLFGSANFMLFGFIALLGAVRRGGRSLLLLGLAVVAVALAGATWIAMALLVSVSLSLPFTEQAAGTVTFFGLEPFLVANSALLAITLTLMAIAVLLTAGIVRAYLMRKASAA
ncbi:MAG: hypothetical protein NXY59_07185 [Aigarchaeota archaeon]|nr:hypothetical protein [Candidatus Pelearchaeum maunauluense]